MIAKKIHTGGENKIVINERIPLNADVEFLLFSKAGNQFVESRQKVIISKNMELPVTFTAVSEKDIKEMALN